MIAVWSHPSQGPLYSAMVEFLAVRIWGKIKPMPEGTIMAVAKGGVIVGGALFNNYDPDAGTIEISAASDDPRWLTRPILWEMFSFPFDQLGCQAVLLRVDPANTRLARILAAYGFVRYDIPRLRGRDKGEAIFILTDDAWRANKFHKEHSHG
jgi:RimJ/RimL family protein N-acetyltransferase